MIVRINTKNILLKILWILKIIFDMFYQYKILNIIVTVIALVLLINSIFKRKLKLKTVDYIILVWTLLFTLSFVKSPSYFIDYIKIISSFLLYFLGRYYSKESVIVGETIKYTLFIALIINVAVVLLGKGSVVWGNAETLRGLYFFKTDLALVLTQFIIFWAIDEKKEFYFKYIPLLLATLLIFFTNARIFYLIAILIFFLIYIYKKNKRLISLRNIILFNVLVIFTIIIISRLSNLSIFGDRNMIGLSINEFSDLFSSSNTQGRNKIWEMLITSFNKQNLLTKVFGSSLDFSYIYGLSGFDEHSLYMKYIVNTGYLGILLLLVFVFNILFVIGLEKDRKISYYSLSLVLIFLVLGISVSTISFTNCSWMVMFYCGAVVSKE